MNLKGKNMKIQRQKRDPLAPKPVHPTSIRFHGFLGPTFLNQHKIIDEKWSIRDLIDEFQGLTDLLSKRVVFQTLEAEAYRRHLYKCSQKLRIQCRDGRVKLQNILHGNNVQAIRKHLLNHKEMQRLYHRMPVHMVLENINQRTFIIRKEEDRLRYRLNQLKQEYKMKMLERAEIENRIKYQNEFVLQEEIRSQQFLERIKKSEIRVKAIRTVQTTYSRVIQILRHDETFYEPILRGLSKDIDDQANFIKHILYLGAPALAEFKILNEKYRIMSDKSRRSTHQKIQTIVAFRKTLPKSQRPRSAKSAELVINISKRYGRETRSMVKLKTELENIESVIKQIKMATLCSNSKEVFPRFRFQDESIYKLTKQSNVSQMHHDFLSFKGKAATEKENVLLHNYSEEEEKRLSRIKFLKEQIKAQEAIEEDTLSYMKNRADVFVVLRFSLWSLCDILRHVGRSTKVYRINYPESYLKLPLLKFEMQTMRACAPDGFEEDTNVILTSLEKKLSMLMKFFIDLTEKESTKEAPKTVDELWEEYHSIFVNTKYVDEPQEEVEEKPVQHDDAFEESRITQNVPNRKQIKLQSAKIVEELSKKEED